MHGHDEPNLTKGERAAEATEATVETAVAACDASSSLWDSLSELLKTGALALLVFLGVRMLVLPYEVEGRSMYPNLHDQERVLVNRAVYVHVDLDQLLGWIPGVDVAGHGMSYPFHPPERGEVVVLNPPSASDEPYIKRVIGEAGDYIEFRDGHVYINQTRLDEPYLSGALTDCDGSDYCNGFTVPEGAVFVLGDNRQHSLDSRMFGPVPLENIIGQAWFVNWPLDKAGTIPQPRDGR